MKAQEVLDAQQASIVTISDARKERFDINGVSELLQAAELIVTAKGKKVRAWDPKTEDMESILKQVMGPSGNLRAPTLRFGTTFLVGFNLEMYEQYMVVPEVLS
ncbi:MAG: ArsC family (seleno)protein [Desulfobulbaceae bacterium]|nr:ArsC family (seleno)protein [Desulfobulbaceae bacterium]